MHKGNSGFRPALETALEAALAHLENVDTTPVSAAADLGSLRRRLGKMLAAEGLPAEQVISELADDVRGGILGTASGRFFGWVVGGSLPAALAADWLTAAWDQNAVLYASGPAAAVAEEIAGGWLKDILGLPERASFALVSGCQMAHVTCLAAARHALLRQQAWDIEQKGLFGAPPVRILANADAHGSIERAVRLLGIGRSQMFFVPADELGRMRPDGLETALRQGTECASIVVLQAGDIHTGAFDDFEALSLIAKSYEAWVHVDGAFGLWAAASPRYKHVTRGIERADSWATDGHKWLNLPFDCGYAFVANPEAHRAAMSHRASYLEFAAEVRDPADWNPEWSRRARGFPTYAALRQLGRKGIANLVERCCAHAQALVRRIGELPDAEVLSWPVINQGLVRFRDPDPNASESHHAVRTDQVIAAILASGEAFFTGSDWKGRRVMRVSVCNWQTSENDVNRAIAAVQRAIAMTGGRETTAAAGTAPDPISQSR
ncbi:MAG TPA: pyridoxal-dependent decarboxylase [Bryobacteraceae bacterium]|nr:pyridoxal-dependent decarboxylase [Bryobacteraceae bacterium]